MLFLRMLSLKEEHKTILQFLPVSKISMGSGSGSASEQMSQAEIDRQYRVILSEHIPLVRFPHVLDIISIVGDSNSYLTSLMMQRILELRTVATNKELVSSLDESFKVSCKESTCVSRRAHMLYNPYPPPFPSLPLLSPPSKNYLNSFFSNKWLSWCRIRSTSGPRSVSLRIRRGSPVSWSIDTSIDATSLISSSSI